MHFYNTDFFNINKIWFCCFDHNTGLPILMVCDETSVDVIAKLKTENNTTVRFKTANYMSQLICCCFIHTRTAFYEIVPRPSAFCVMTLFFLNIPCVRKVPPPHLMMFLLMKIVRFSLGKVYTTKGGVFFKYNRDL